MKKVLYVFLLLFATVSLNAQIKRDVFGLSMGQPIEEAVRSLEAKGYTFNKSTSVFGETYVSNEAVQFAGCHWTEVVLCASYGRLYKISFVYNDISSRGVIDLNAKILPALSQKYQAYLQNIQDKRTDSEHQIITPFTDEETCVMLTLTLKDASNQLLLSYMDKSTALNMDAVEKDEF